MTARKSSKPWHDDPAMKEVARLFSRRPARVQVMRWAHHWSPPTDVIEAEDDLFVMVEIAGMQAKDIKIALHHRRLMITGTRTKPSAEHAIHQMEIMHGEFRTDIELPAPVNSAEVEADYSDGFLIVKLPKQKSRTVTVSK